MSRQPPSHFRRVLHNARSMVQNPIRRWCIHHSGLGCLGRAAAWVATWNTQPYHQRASFAEADPRGFIAPTASISHRFVRMGKHVYLGDGVIISEMNNGGQICLDDRVCLYGNSFLISGSGGQIHIGARTHVQPGCHLHAHLGRIRIGEAVEIASNCGFFPYDHGTARGQLVMDQPLTSRGDIIIGDGAWIGFGSSILQGVHIHAGAIIGAGSVVTRDIPQDAIAAGAPARIIGFRQAADTPKQTINRDS